MRDRAASGPRSSRCATGTIQLKDAYADAREAARSGSTTSTSRRTPAAARENHEPERPRKLLLHRREIERLIGKTSEKGLTLVPTRVYFKGPWREGRDRAREGQGPARQAPRPEGEGPEARDRPRPAGARALSGRPASRRTASPPQDQVTVVSRLAVMNKKLSVRNKCFLCDNIFFIPASDLTPVGSAAVCAVMTSGCDHELRARDDSATLDACLISEQDAERACWSAPRCSSRR